MKTQLQHDGDRVWIEGVNGWFRGDKESSVHAAQEAVMQVVGEKIAYDDLLGVSGLAFRMQIHKDSFCGSSPHASCGYPCVERSIQSLGWNVRHFEVQPAEQAQVAEARRAMVESINRGVPVQYGHEEDGVIVGYQKQGEEWICLHPYHEWGKKTFVETHWPWRVAVFVDPKPDVPSRKALAREALKQAVDMARTQESGGYFLGFRAWDEYAQRLKTLEITEEKMRPIAMQGNAWIYECLAQYRASAARYLHSVAGEFDLEPSKHLNHASGLYERIAHQMLRDDAQCTWDIAPYPYSQKEIQQWTGEMRREQARRLETALPVEREAIAEIELALGLINSTF